MVAFTGWILYGAAFPLAFAGIVTAWAGYLALVCILVSFGIGIWFYFTRGGVERAIAQRARDKYERHKRAGRVGRSIREAGQRHKRAAA